MVIMYIFAIYILQYILLMSKSNICEIVLQEHVYGHYFLEYTWVITILVFPGKNLFIWDAAHYEL